MLLPLTLPSSPALSFFVSLRFADLEELSVRSTGALRTVEQWSKAEKVQAEMDPILSVRHRNKKKKLHVYTRKQSLVEANIALKSATDTLLSQNH